VRGTTGQTVATLVLAVTALGSAGCMKASEPAVAAPAPPAAAPAPAPAPAAAPAEDAIARGTALYATNCAACHGTEGKGDGALAVFLMPRPRNFTLGRYRFTSTLQRKPTDEDLLRTIRRGIPGSAMPPFAQLPAKDLEALVARIKSLSATPIDASADPARPDETGPVPFPAEPADDVASRARGFELYGQNCASCHGLTGHGDALREQFDDQEMSVWPRDFSAGEWKGGGEPRDLYRRIVAGMAGSPMPASPQLRGDDAWHLVHWVRSQADQARDADSEQIRRSLVAARVPAGVPADPAAPAWDGAREQWVAVMPLWSQPGRRVRGLFVSALHDGKEIALRLRWEDPTDDSSTFGQQEFRDGVAVQVSTDPEPPIFAMGALGRPVAIWMWKADRQADAARGADLESRFPRMAADGYPVAGGGTCPIRPNIPLAEHDPLFLSGKAAGNDVSDLSGARPAESLRARGPGTLERAAGAVAADGRGVRSSTGWMVVLRRTLADGSPGGVTLAPGGKASVAFAVWDGSRRDRNGSKSVTIWHELSVSE